MGIHVPLITPFDEAGRVDAGALGRLAHEVADGGVAGLVALGTTAEAAMLDEAEKAVVRETVGRVCRERGLRYTVGAGGRTRAGPRRNSRSLTRTPRWCPCRRT